MPVSGDQQDTVPGGYAKKGYKPDDRRDADGSRCQPDTYHAPNKCQGKIKQYHKSDTGIFKFLVQDYKNYLVPLHHIQFDGSQP